jgi:uncharacterized protein YjbJ (UPF0337 family)
MDKEKMMGKAEQLKGRAEQVVGIVTGSKETQARGEVTEVQGKARETVAEIKGDIKKAVDGVPVPSPERVLISPIARQPVERRPNNARSAALFIKNTINNKRRSN